MVGVLVRYQNAAQLFCLCAKLPQRAGGGTGTFSQIHQKKAAILFQKCTVAG